MKKATLLLFTLISFYCNSQSGMTNEEYQYLTTGIKTQIENGLDIKKEGYTLKLIGGGKSFKGSYSEVTIKAFVKGEKEFKGFLITIVRTGSTKSDYIAIPFNNDELMKKYIFFLKNCDENIKNEIMLALTIYYSKDTFFSMKTTR